jgi:hypothetical protein
MTVYALDSHISKAINLVGLLLKDWSKFVGVDKLHRLSKNSHPLA